MERLQWRWTSAPGGCLQLEVVGQGQARSGATAPGDQRDTFEPHFGSGAGGRLQCMKVRFRWQRAAALSGAMIVCDHISGVVARGTSELMLLIFHPLRKEHGVTE